MLWGQWINVYTDHKNLTRDGLGLTSDRVARWRILLEEYAPEISYIKEIHNTIADAISRLDYDPKLNTTNEYNCEVHESKKQPSLDDVLEILVMFQQNSRPRRSKPDRNESCIHKS